MATANKITHFDDPWLGTAKTTVTVGMKTGEEKKITINANTLDGKTEGGDISAAGITIGASIEGGNPLIGVSTDEGSEVHATLPLSIVGVLIKGVSMGSSHTDGNNVITNTEHSYKLGQNTIMTAGAAAILYFNPFLIPFALALKSALQ